MRRKTIGLPGGAARGCLGAAACLVAAGFAATEAGAQGLRLSGASSSGRVGLFASQTALLDSRAATQYSGATRLQPPSAQANDAIPRYDGAYRGAHMATARQAARKHGIPEDLFLRLVQRESAWNAGAVSHKGATGLAQLMPGTAQILGVDPNDPAQNLDGGARYLRMMYDRFGNWRLALAAYNAGPEAVDRHGGIPPYAETQTYVKLILGG